jgi:hypothetical protein
VRGTAGFLLVTTLVAGVASGAGDEPSHSKQPLAAPDGRVACTAAGIDVTVRLAYDVNRVGLVSAAYVDLGFSAPLALPPDSTADQLRGRMKVLMASPHRIAPPVKRGSSIRVAVTTTEPGIPLEDLFRFRFDCAAGAHVRSRDLGCTTAEVGDTAGLPMPEILARNVRCTVSRLEPAEAASPR